MNEREFAYWLQGYAEIGGDAPTPEQWAVIKDHLALVFKKVTPAHGGTLSIPVKHFTRSECTGAGDPNFGKAIVTC